MALCGSSLCRTLTAHLWCRTQWLWNIFFGTQLKAALTILMIALLLTTTFAPSWLSNFFSTA